MSLRKRMWAGSGFALSVTAVLLTAAMGGCPQPSPPEEVADLAVGDIGSNITKDGKAFDAPQILLYFDVLGEGGQQDPDVVLNGNSVPLLRPTFMRFADGDLYVCDSLQNRILIWRDYATLSDNDMPDAVLGAASGLVQPWVFEVYNNRLIVSDNTGAILIFDNASGITGDVAADVVLPVVAARLAVASDVLYAVDQPGQRVLVWENLSMVTSGAPPDVALQGASFLENPLIYLNAVSVYNNHLYVSAHSASLTDGYVFVFSPADALLNGQGPDAVLTPSAGRLQFPGDVVVVGPTLYVADTVSSDNIGCVGFGNASSLETGQAPLTVLDASRSLISSATDLSAVGTTLFVAAQSGYSSTKSAATGDVHIFYRAEWLPDGDRADIRLPGLKDFAIPLSLATAERTVEE